MMLLVVITGGNGTVLIEIQLERWVLCLMIAEFVCRDGGLFEIIILMTRAFGAIIKCFDV